MAVVEISKILVRRGQELQTGIPRLDAGEFGWAEDTEHLYIGKRMAEGAVSDDNTRILTENDLNFFSLLANNTGSVTSAYRYRDTVTGEQNPYLVHTQLQTVQKKLDSLNPALTDFGLVISTSTSTVISTELQNAINDLFANPTVDPLSFTQSELRRPLMIPAGSYIVSSPIDLPPYTKIIGSGPELTRIIYTNSSTSLFRTIDADGNRYADGMVSGILKSKEVYIEGLSLEFSNQLTTAQSLISLDNVTNAKIKNCIFRTEIGSSTASSYGLVSHGIGVRIRGDGGVGSEFCENITIEDCRFDSLNIGVSGVGSVVRPEIRSGFFNNLQKGVSITANGSLPGPINGSVVNSRFQNIVTEAIYVGPNLNNERSGFLSSDNYFKDVGNGVNLRDNTPTTSTSCTSVLKFLAPGCRSVNDTYYRKAYADVTTSTSFYYNPLINGNTTLSDLAVYTATILTNNVDVPLVKIPLNGSDQLVSMSYQLIRSGYSRKGMLKINITPDGYSTYSDDYTFIEYLTQISEESLPVAEGSGENLLVIDPGYLNTELANVFYNDFQPGQWYINSNLPEWGDSVAYISGISTGTGFLVITTESSNPTFNFNHPSTPAFFLLRSDSGEVSFTFADNIEKNYLLIQGTNDSAISDAQIEYQVEIQT